MAKTKGWRKKNVKFKPNLDAQDIGLKKWLRERRLYSEPCFLGDDFGNEHDYSIVVTNPRKARREGTLLSK